MSFELNIITNMINTVRTVMRTALKKVERLYNIFLYSIVRPFFIWIKIVKLKLDSNFHNQNYIQIFSA